MKMKFKVFLFFALLLAVPVREVQAHVLKTDGSVGAVIHVSPEDDPIARESTDFFFEFKDKQGKFKPDNCECNGIILQGGKEIYSVPLFQNSANPSLTNASFSFAFPEKDVYKVRVSGKPITPGAFEPFTLTWDIRVARESTTNSTTDTTTQNTQESGLSRYIVPGIAASLLIVMGVFLLYKHTRTKRDFA